MPTSPPTQPTTGMDVLLPLIQQRLMLVTTFPEERVIIDARDDEDDLKSQADQYVLLRGGGGSPGPDFQGAGRNSLVLNEEIVCILHTRLQTDEATSDAQFLTNRSLGHYVARGLIWSALAGFQPVDADGNWLVTEPIWPRTYSKPRKSKARPGWGSSSLAFNVQYSAKIDTSYQ